VAATPLTKIINDKNLESAFRVIDSDLSGKLSAVELKAHLGEDISEHHYKKIIEFCDLDRDG
jgi:Ca2+-binding EF-hand superfamily protein